jgi:hypothetical protein
VDEPATDAGIPVPGLTLQKEDTSHRQAYSATQKHDFPAMLPSDSDACTVVRSP